MTGVLGESGTVGSWGEAGLACGQDVVGTLPVKCAVVQPQVQGAGKERRVEAVIWEAGSAQAAGIVGHSAVTTGRGGLFQPLPPRRKKGSC